MQNRQTNLQILKYVASDHQNISIACILYPQPVIPAKSQYGYINLFEPKLTKK